MWIAWDLVQEVKFRALGDDLCTTQFSCLGDWTKVMEGGPWAFRGCPVILAPYDGFAQPSTIELTVLRYGSTSRYAKWYELHG